MPDREYFNNRRKARRAKFIDLLGGKCERCGATEDLHFDHKCPKKKEFRIADRIDAPEDILLKEVKKCILMCALCHRDKTREKNEHGQPKARHGTLWMYKKYKCRCHKCKKRMSEYNKLRRVAFLKMAGAADITVIIRNLSMASEDDAKSLITDIAKKIVELIHSPEADDIYKDLFELIYSLTEINKNHQARKLILSLAREIAKIKMSN